MSSAEFLDPRIKGELERLNSTSSDINRLEREIDDIRHQFRHVLSESSQRLNDTGKKCIKAIQRAHPYHEAKKAEREAHENAQNAALKYQRAVGMFRAAKETILIAEEASMEGATKKRDFDSALQELLNHATVKLNESEKEKIVKEKEHEERSRDYIAAQKRVEQLSKKHRKSIAKSGHYFDLRESFYHRLNGMKTRMESLQSQAAVAKKQYRQALKSLQNISEEIHQNRQLQALLAEERSRGVGADSDTSDSSGAEEANRLNLDHLSLDETIAAKSIAFPGDNNSCIGDRESDIDGKSACATPTSPNPFDIFEGTNFVSDVNIDRQKQKLDGNGNYVNVEDANAGGTESRLETESEMHYPKEDNPLAIPECEANGPVSKEQGPDDVIFEKDQGPDDVIVEKQQVADDVIAEKEQGPDDVIVEKEQGPDVIVETPDDVIVEKGQGPDDVIVEKDQGPDDVIVEKEQGPDDDIVEKAQGPADVMVEKEHGPDDVIVENGQGTDDDIVEKELGHDDVIVGNGKGHDDVIVEKDQGPDDFIVEKDQGPDDAIVEKRQEPDDVIVEKEQEPDDVIVEQISLV